jgi:hypothetical protein
MITGRVNQKILAIQASEGTLFRNTILQKRAVRLLQFRECAAYGNSCFR